MIGELIKVIFCNLNNLEVLFKTWEKKKEREAERKRERVEDSPFLEGVIKVIHSDVNSQSGQNSDEMSGLTSSTLSNDGHQYKKSHNECLCPENIGCHHGLKFTS